MFRFALVRCPVNGFSPRNRAALNTSDLCPTAYICGRVEWLRLSAKVRVVLEPEGTELGSRLAESPIPYRVKRKLAKSP